MLIGADEGLHGVSMNAGPKKTLVEISGLDHVYHIEILGKLGIAIIIAGE